MSLAKTRCYGIFAINAKEGDPPLALIDAHTPAGALAYYTASTLVVRQPTVQEVIAATLAGLKLASAGRIDEGNATARATEAAQAAARG